MCEKYKNLLIIGETLYLSGCGGIGRRAGFRFQWETVGVQVPSSAPHKNPYFDTKYGFLFLCLKMWRVLATRQFWGFEYSLTSFLREKFEKKSIFSFDRTYSNLQK